MADCLDEAQDDFAEETLKTPTHRRRTSKWWAHSNAFRAKRGLRGLSQRGGAPFYSEQDLTTWRLSRREVDVIDCAYLLFEKLEGEVPETLIIDVSQSVLREPWKRDGHCMSFHVGGKYFFKGRLLTAQTCFNMMGWPRSTAVIPPNLSASAVARLLGNMVATPVIGAVFGGLLREIQL